MKFFIFQKDPSMAHELFLKIISPLHCSWTFLRTQFSPSMAHDLLELSWIHDMNFGDLRLCYIYIFDSFLRCNPSQKWFHVSEKYGPCKRSMTIILKFEKTKLNLALRNTFLIKVHIFLKGHKILQNLHLTFVWHYIDKTKVRWKFRKILWPPQNIWTLKKN